MRNASENAPSPNSSPLSQPPSITPHEPLDMATLLAQQQSYAELRRNVALGVLVLAPAVIAIPPRKLDAFTAGLAGAWVFCLNDLVKQRYGDNMVRVVTGRPKAVHATPEVNWRGGWRGEDVRKRAVELGEDDEQGIMEMIKQRVWDVWQQKDKRNLTPEEEEQENRPLRERMEEILEKDKKNQAEREE